MILPAADGAEEFLPHDRKYHQSTEMINEDEISAKSMSAEYKNLFSERESEENNIAVLFAVTEILKN